MRDRNDIALGVALVLMLWLAWSMIMATSPEPDVTIAPGPTIHIWATPVDP